MHGANTDASSVTGLLSAPSYGLPAFLMSQGSVVVLSLTAGYVYILIHTLGETKKVRISRSLVLSLIEGLTSPQLSHIPSLGFSDPILSYWSAFRYVLDPPGFLCREWQRVRIQPYQKHEMTDIVLFRD